MRLKVLPLTDEKSQAERLRQIDIVVAWQMGCLPIVSVTTEIREASWRAGYAGACHCDDGRHTLSGYTREVDKYTQDPIAMDALVRYLRDTRRQANIRVSATGYVCTIPPLHWFVSKIGAEHALACAFLQSLGYRFDGPYLARGTQIHTFTRGEHPETLTRFA